MPTIQEIRQQYPQYADIPDQQLADSLHQKFYSDLPKQDFYSKIGLNTQSQPISTAEDVAKSVGSNAVGGALDVAMTLPNIVNQIAAGPQLLGRGIAENVDKLIGIEPQPRGELWQPFFSSGDVEKMIGTDYQPQTTAGKIAALPTRIAAGIAGAKGIQKASDVITAPSKLGASDIRELSSQSFADAEAKGGILKPHITDNFVSEASNVLPQTRAGKIVIGETPTTKLIDRLQSLKGKSLTLNETQEIDSALGEMMSNEVEPLTGKLNAEGNKLLKIQQSLRDTIEKAGVNDTIGGKEGFNALDKARKLWAASARANDIERIISRAQTTENPVTALKTGFRTLVSNPSRLRGFTPQEVRAIKNAARTGILTGALKFMGSRLISSMSGAIAGAAGGGPVGAGLGMVAGAAAGTPFREGANILQTNRANKVLDMIANRPVVQNASGRIPLVSNPNVSRIGAISPLFDLNKLLQN